jgi:hypothetical protein
MKSMPADVGLDAVFLPESPEGRDDLFRPFGLVPFCRGAPMALRS